MMANVKKTNRGIYTDYARANEMLLSMADIILDVGADQERWPQKLSTGFLDMEDTTKEQFALIEKRKASLKRDRENSVAELAATGKKRASKEERQAKRMFCDQTSSYEAQLNEDEDDVVYGQEDDYDDEDSIKGGEAAKVKRRGRAFFKDQIQRTQKG